MEDDEEAAGRSILHLMLPRLPAAIEVEGDDSTFLMQLMQLMQLSGSTFGGRRLGEERIRIRIRIRI